MKENALVDFSKQFAVDIVNICTDIKEHRKSNVLLNQLLRSGTSVGANIHEANYASSKADFVNKLQIALKESSETGYWLEILHKAHYIDESSYKKLNDVCTSLRVMLISSIRAGLTIPTLHATAFSFTSKNNSSRRFSESFLESFKYKMT